MPMGPGPLGFVYFMGIKFAGYAGAAAVLRKVYPASADGPLKVGGIRTLIGMGAGLAYGAVWMLLFTKSQVASSDAAPFLYPGGLFPVRIAEWLFLIHLYFDRRLVNRDKSIGSAIGGTIWSYCLDAIGVGAAFVIPGGIWIC
jgi:hypothetical protein